uniref:PH domain-containing protein n=1 Tax=Panagrolaimus sp. JU765 TaxID=591449 RepID=A0AC34QTP1_9BILA
MSRKITACGHLYVAPVGLDFSVPSHTARRWQRRFFTLYDDGELSFALDDNPETIPQLILNLNNCVRVCEAEAITHHANSILLSFKKDQLSLSETHPVVVYLKADTLEEIRGWQNVIQQYAKQNVYHMTPSYFRKTNDYDESNNPMLFSPPPPLDIEESIDSDKRINQLDPVVIPVVNSSQENSISSRSLDEHKRVNSVTSLDNNSNAIRPDNLFPTMELAGTPRSIKQRDRLAREDSRVINQNQSQVLENISRTCQIDTSTVTLRKGWLMLRGKNENEWIKHWAVLAGLSLSLYKDIWAEDANDPVLCIDLTECENVYPSASAKNYGIEIKCRRQRYILSAMTPGIRDSWIQALQQNLHNPSPTYPIDVSASLDGHSQADSADLISLPTRKKKHIAYVAPESHHSNSLMDDGSSATEAEIEEEFQAAIQEEERRQRSTSVMSRSTGSDISGRQRRSRSVAPQRIEMLAETDDQREIQRRFRGQSISPTIRRSPVNKIKEKSSERTRRESCKSTDSIENRQSRFAELKSQVQLLRNQLQETKNLLSESQSENERLRNLFNNSNDSEELNKLRRCLTAAEQDVIKHQTEMDMLRKQYEKESNGYGSPKNNFPSDVCTLEVSRWLVSLLKVQVGALSKVLHSSQSPKFDSLRQIVDKLIRTVAVLDENKEQTMNRMETAFDDVVAAYEKLANLIDYRGQDLIYSKSHQLASSSEDLLKDIQDLEGELEEVQAVHNEEMEAFKIEFERQIKTLKERLGHEESSRKKLQEELSLINSTNEQRLTTLRNSYEETIKELREQFENDLKKLKQEHSDELEDEKNATRLALDAVRRAHEEELEQAMEKMRKEQQLEASSNLINTNDAVRDRQAKVIEQITNELTNLSAMYSAKCLENSQLDEKMQSLIMDKENDIQKEEIETQNRKLQRELRQKDTTIDELKLRIITLERKLDVNSTDALEKEVQEKAVTQRQRRTRSRPSGTSGSSSVIRLARAENNAVDRVPSSRRHDQRYHSNPIIPVMSEITGQDMFIDEMRKTLAVPVSERRKFFERVAEYNSPF